MANRPRCGRATAQGSALSLAVVPRTARGFTLAEILTDVSEFYDRQLKATIKSVTAAIEPLMIILMGGIVAFIASSILLPIYKMSQLVK